MKTVYICFNTDIIHEGHLNIIKNAKKYGELIAGVMSDEAMVRFDRFPTIPFEERYALIQSLPDISKVVIQKDVMYENILRELKPDYVVHGDNWVNGPQKAVRENVIETLKEWGGELIELPYTYNEKVKKIDKVQREKLAMPEFRRRRLKQLIKLCPIVKAIEAHNGLTGLIAEKTE